VVVDNNVVRLADRANDGTLWSVEDMLEESLREVKTGERKCNKAIVVFFGRPRCRSTA
jgi:endonuclease III